MRRLAPLASTLAALAALLAPPARAQAPAPVVVPPVRVKSARPVYPEKERKENVTGSVVVDILIDETGAVSDTDVVSSPGEAFSKAADACVRKWRFRPGTKDGVPAAFRQTVTIDFRLKASPAPAATPRPK